MRNSLFVQQCQIIYFENCRVFLVTWFNQTLSIDEQTVTWQTLDRFYPNMCSYP